MEENKVNIKDYGFKENLIINNTGGRIPARIIATHKERYELVCECLTEIQVPIRKK